MRSTTHASAPTSTTRPVSSRTSRATACARVSPRSSLPPGTVHRPRRGRAALDEQHAAVAIEHERADGDGSVSSSSLPTSSASRLAPSCSWPSVAGASLRVFAASTVRLAAGVDERHEGARAQRREQAVFVVGLLRMADAAAVPDQAVREARPLVPRQELHQVLLDLHRIGLRRQAEPLRRAASRGCRRRRPRACRARCRARRWRSCARRRAAATSSSIVLRDLAAVPLDDAPRHAEIRLFAFCGRSRS